MRKVYRHALLASALLLAAAPAVGSSNDASLIADVRSAWEGAMNDRDIFGALAHYGPGAVVLPVGDPPQLGAAEIAAWHRRWFSGADVYFAFEPISLRISGAQAVEEWSADVTLTRYGDGATSIGRDPVQFRQHGARVYRKVGGRWRIDREVWSTPLPGAVAGTGF